MKYTRYTSLVYYFNKRFTQYLQGFLLTQSGELPPALKIKKNKKGKKLLKQINRIQVQYSTDPGFPEGNTVTKSVGKKKSSVKLKLQRKRTYYVRVRYVGNGGYSNWSGVKKVKTK